MDNLIVYSAAPLVAACTGLALWKLAYVGRRPLSRKVKLIVIAILIWASLPLGLWLNLTWLGAMGGHLGD